MTYKGWYAIKANQAKDSNIKLCGCQDKGRYTLFSQGFYQALPDISIYILFSSMFTNGLRDQDSIPGQVRPKTKNKMVLDSHLLSTQHYKVRIKGEVEQSNTLPYTTMW